MDDYDKEEIRRRLPMADLVEADLGELRRASGNYQVCCPFHDEKSASFYIYKDHGHCYGCGWHGDVFNYRMDRSGMTFPETVESLAQLVGISPTTATFTASVKRPASKPRSEKKMETAPHPPLRELRSDEIKQLAELRGLDPLGVRAAAKSFRRVGVCYWPQFLNEKGEWVPSRSAVPSWVVTDDRRYCLQYRRLDGEPYRRKDGGEIKAWTATGSSPKWPLGAADIGERWRVMLVEGGADMLAAYHFLRGLGILDKVAAVGMMGCSNRIAEEALPFFRGKRVRIFIDADRAKPTTKAASTEPLAEPFGADGLPVIPDGWMVPSLEGARVWQEQLTSAGAAVETIRLYGLKTAAGSRVGDLNDLALCDALTLTSELVSAAFFQWDF